MLEKREYLSKGTVSIRIKGSKNGKKDKSKADNVPDKFIPPNKTPEALAKKYANAKWTPEDDKEMVEIRKKMATHVRRPANPAISELVTVQITVAPDAQPGQREIRLATASGLSNPVVFCVGQLPEFSEEASRNIAETEEPDIEGRLRSQEQESQDRTQDHPAGDRKRPDTARRGGSLPFHPPRKAQKLVIAVQARQLIPYISDAVPGWFQATLSLYDAKGKELAYDDDFQFNPDPALYYEIPADGEYVIEIKDSIFRGREGFCLSHHRR